MEESAIYRHAEVSPRVPVELSGGVMIFCDPAGYKHIPNRTDPKWRISVSVHPKKIKDLTPPRLQHLQSLLLQPWVVAFGEIGLDYRESDTDRERQRAQLEELLSLCSPRHVLVLHIRGNKKEHMSEQAFKDCFESVKKHVPRDQRIHLHCFSGGHNQVTKWSEAFPNCHFGYTGKVARFIKSQREAVRRVPIERVLIETDSPYLPVHAGQKINTPVYLGDVANLVASIRQEQVTQILHHTERNGQILYPPYMEGQS